MSELQSGTVKFYNTEKGFGFITQSDSGKDVFFHVSGLVDKVADGDPVTYEVVDGDRGKKAVNVRLNRQS